MQKQLLLFIMPFNGYTLIHYGNGKVEILRMPVHSYLKANMAKTNTPINIYKQAIMVKDITLFPTHGVRNENCCWINAAIIFDFQVFDYHKIIIDYGINISLEKVAVNCIKAVQN